MIPLRNISRGARTHFESSLNTSHLFKSALRSKWIFLGIPFLVLLYLIQVTEYPSRLYSSTPKPFDPLPEIYASNFSSLQLPDPLLHDHNLATRLDTFLRRPILSHEDAVEEMYVGCPKEISDNLVNPDQYNGDGDFWRDTVDVDEIVKRRVQVVNWLEDWYKSGRIKSITGNGGKGIVMTAGNSVCYSLSTFTNPHILEGSERANQA